MLKVLLLQIVTIFTLYAQNSNYVELSANALVINNEKYITVNLKNTEGWHTYWKNPGDAGLPIKFSFFVNNDQINLNPLEWPTPKRYVEQGDILAYGYSNENSFFFKISKNNYEKILKNSLKVKAEWLVCKDICIPGEGSTYIDFSKNLPLKSKNSNTDNDTLLKRFRQLPINIKNFNDLEMTLVKGKKENTLALQYSLTNVNLDQFDKEINLITPFPTPLLDFKREKLVYDKETKSLFGQIIINWDGEYEEPPILIPNDGVFKKSKEIKFLLQDNGKYSTKVISKSFDSFSLNGFGQFEKFISTRTLGDKVHKKSKSIIYYILFAFIGGLILNLMPCVLPVISLKLFGLIAHSDESNKKILRHNLFYSFGVWSTFMALALVVLILKLSGEQIGWGFQLQSPLFVFIMMLVIFIMTLNLFGLFEFITPGGKTLGAKEFKKGVSADFFNGVLATVLSTPCSAPFLGVALTFAFTTNNFNIFIIFTSVAIGLSFPFILTGFFPKLISFLPKPGNWMIKLKYFLGFTMLLTFAWLYDVLFALIDSSVYGVNIHLIFATLFFAYFLRKNISKKFILSFIFFSLPLILFISLYSNEGFKVYSKDSISIKSDLNWKKWSIENMQKNKGQWTFIDFTATWCLTCKVNKKLVLDTDNFAKLVKEKDLNLLIGDWTKRDEAITQFLRKYDIVGVPAYFLQDPNGKIIHLGETVSIQKILDNIN